MALCFVTATVISAFRVASVPDYIAIEWSNDFDVGTAADAQACLDAAYEANSAFEAISFNNVTGACSYHSALFGTVPRSSGEQPQYWVRIDRHMQTSAMTSCLADQDAMYLLAQLAFMGQTRDCEMAGWKLDPTTGLCLNEYDYTYYDYEGGHLGNGTGYYISRSLALRAVSYVCDDVWARK
ncbi:hypothetical protein AAVH_09137, partial [Aphelenchoides avenae]